MVATPDSALGYATASQTGITSFNGLTVSGSNVLIKYTYFGDMNLSGLVDLTDYSLLAAGFGNAGFWYDGDCNYDGTVNLTDFSLLAANFSNSGTTPRLSGEDEIDRLMPLYEGLLTTPNIYFEVRDSWLWDTFKPIEEAYLNSGRLMPPNIPEPVAALIVLGSTLLLRRHRLLARGT